MEIYNIEVNQRPDGIFLKRTSTSFWPLFIILELIVLYCEGLPQKLCTPHCAGIERASKPNHAPKVICMKLRRRHSMEKSCFF